MQCIFWYSYVFLLGTVYKEDRRMHNLLYRKSKLESINETSALLSGFANVNTYDNNRV